MLLGRLGSLKLEYTVLVLITDDYCKRNRTLLITHSSERLENDTPHQKCTQTDRHTALDSIHSQQKIAIY